jgi:uncharacterized protein
MEGTAEKREGVVVPSVDLKAAVASAHAVLAAHASKIDALNVYPVPDGDTGTNMLLTLRSILEKASVTPGLGREEAARVVSRAALMGARGNSGVILSQILRGACEVLGKARALDAEAIAAAIAGAKERAYAAVSDPVEGTMLSVVKDAADAARSCIERGEMDRLEVFRAAAREAHASVKRTPEQLDVLKEAGVVDAGGLGVAVILDGLLAALSGEEPALVDLEEERPRAGGERLQNAMTHSAEEAWGYCTEFFVDGFSGDEEEFEAHIHEIGKSVLVIPDDGLVKVHLHTQDPGEALTYAGRFGRLSGVKVDDMEAQTRARTEDGDSPVSSKIVANIGVVAASRGTGNRKLFESMGAVVVEGGQGANPSAEELARAVEATGSEDVILLPNNKNVVPAAERVGELVEARIHVIPTTSMACGLAVMVGFDADEGEVEEVVEEMREISRGLRCAEVTRAVRGARVEGRQVMEGAYIGLLDGRFLATEDRLEDVALALVERMIEEGADMVTLLRGGELEEAAAERIVEAIRRLDGDLSLEVRDGGQPLYPLQMVAE